MAPAARRSVFSTRQPITGPFHSCLHLLGRPAAITPARADGSRTPAVAALCCSRKFREGNKKFRLESPMLPFALQHKSTPSHTVPRVDQRHADECTTSWDAWRRGTKHFRARQCVYIRTVPTFDTAAVSREHPPTLMQATAPPACTRVRTTHFDSESPQHRCSRPSPPAWT